MDARALRLATAEAAITEGVKRENICKVTVSDHEPRFSLMGSSLLYDKTATTICTKDCCWGSNGYHFARTPAFQCTRCNMYFQTCGRVDASRFWWSTELGCDCDQSFGSPPSINMNDQCTCAKTQPFLEQHEESLVRAACQLSV